MLSRFRVLSRGHGVPRARQAATDALSGDAGT